LPAMKEMGDGDSAGILHILQEIFN
jgi:hypothetical protein